MQHAHLDPDSNKPTTKVLSETIRELCIWSDETEELRLTSLHARMVIGYEKKKNILLQIDIYWIS